MTTPPPSPQQLRAHQWRLFRKQMRKILDDILADNRAKIESAHLNGWLHTVNVRTVPPPDGITVLDDGTGQPIHLQPAGPAAPLPDAEFPPPSPLLGPDGSPLSEPTGPRLVTP